MTHVLNYALRKTLGGEVDQKGSLVSDEKFRFDFSFNRAVSSDELSAIEGIVSDVVKAELEVHTDVVALKDALAVQGLRAVFGETYPDPVRVVSVGPKVRSLVCFAMPSPVLTLFDFKFHFVLYCIVLYCIVLYCIVLYCFVLYCIALYCFVLYPIAAVRTM